MKAAYIEEQGDVSNIKVGELPTPEPGPGQVRVRVGAAALNPVDLYLRAGVIPMPIPMPYVIGCDLAGTVEKVGPGVTRFQVGDRVWASNQGLLNRNGTAAEYAVVDEGWLYPTPDGMDDTGAAAWALVGITAHLGLFDRGRLESGQSLYVAGGGGGVGSMVIQMAKAAGARVATAAGHEQTLTLSRDLGADLVLNYKTEDVPKRLAEWAPDGLDLWYETQREPNLEAAIPLLKVRGRMVLMAGRDAKPALPLGAFYPRNNELLGFAMFNFKQAEQQRCAEDMNRWAAAGQLKPIIGKTFPLDQAAEAQTFLEENTIGGAGTLVGKIVITPIG